MTVAFTSVLFTIVRLLSELMERVYDMVTGERPSPTEVLLPAMYSISSISSCWMVRKVESKSISSAGISNVNVPSAPTGMLQAKSSPMEIVISTASSIMSKPLSEDPAWCVPSSKSSHVVSRSTHPPSAISISRLAPVAMVASSKPTATPPPFSPAFVSVTTTIHSPGAMFASQMRTSSTSVPVMVTGSRTASKVG